MKKIILIFVAVFALNSFTLLNASSNIEDAIIETTSPSCWSAADAAEKFVCGSVGCNFDLWDAVYAACMGYQDN